MNGKPWTAAQITKLRALYSDTQTVELAAQLGRPICSVYAKAAALGLKKSQAYLYSPAACRLRRPGPDGKHPGAQFWYPKGHVPANKGLRRPGYAPGRMAETQFKKGQRRADTRKIGDKRVIDGYWYTKVSEVPNVAYNVNWKPTHHLLWQKHRGAIPPGHCLTFKDGDRNNIKIKNLKLITRGENAVRNNMWTNYPPELAKAIQLRGVLKRRLKRSAVHEKQD